MTAADRTMFDDYLRELADDQREALQAVIDHVAAIAPEAAEGRSYGLPAFMQNGRPLLGFAATSGHLSLYPFSPAVIDGVRDRLTGYRLSKGTVRFTTDRPLPDDVVTDMVRRRLDEISGA
jgi:uncharacterized protein YdhG (YjbR/CyaY superfamily)